MYTKDVPNKNTIHMFAFLNKHIVLENTTRFFFKSSLTRKNVCRFCSKIYSAMHLLCCTCTLNIKVLLCISIQLYPLNFCYIIKHK